ncbi:MAG: 3-oxoadipate CoA-transferase [Gammaproteobacteria bacterium]|nr:3-oxoadipate CoA-transferase [Gammaproteobacteria bacterium]
MIDKIVTDPVLAVADIADGATVLVGGFAWAGVPSALLEALAERQPRNLTIATNANIGAPGLMRLFETGCVRKLMSSFPRMFNTTLMEDLCKAGKLVLELIPQGTLAERIRAAGAGIPAFYTPAAVGTPLAADKEHRDFAGVTYIMETALAGDVALIMAAKGDRWGNLVYNKTARNFNPIMAMAGKLCLAQVAEVAELGTLNPEQIITPGIFVDQVIPVTRST